MYSSSASLSTIETVHALRRAHTRFPPAIFRPRQKCNAAHRHRPRRTRNNSPPETMSNPAPALASSLQDGAIRIRLNRITNQMIELAERGIEPAVMISNRACAVDIKRRAVLFARPLRDSSLRNARVTVAVMKGMQGVNRSTPQSLQRPSVTSADGLHWSGHVATTAEQSRLPKSRTSNAPKVQTIAAPEGKIPPDRRETNRRHRRARAITQPMRRR